MCLMEKVHLTKKAHPDIDKLPSGDMEGRNRELRLPQRFALGS